MKEEQADFLDTFDTDTDDVAAPAVAPSPEPQTDSGQPRNPDGTFATTKAEKDAAELVAKGVKPEGQQPSEPELPSGQEDQHVPLSVVIALRKELQALKAGKKAETPAQANAQPNSPTPKGPEFTPPQIDPEDPQSYATAFQSMRMQQSHFFAVQQSSEPEVAEAWAAFDAACEAAPGVGQASIFSQTLVNHPHPMGEVLKWHRLQKEQQMLQEAGGLEGLKRRWLAEQGAQPASVATAAIPAQPASRPAPPPSLANGGAGAHADPGIPSEDDDFTGFFEGARKPRKR